MSLGSCRCCSRCIVHEHVYSTQHTAYSTPHPQKATVNNVINQFTGGGSWQWAARPVPIIRLPENWRKEVAEFTKVLLVDPVEEREGAVVMLQILRDAC